MTRTEANPFLPPVSPALETHSTYVWCQVTSVFARELARAAGQTSDPVAWTKHWSEASDLTSAIRSALGDSAALGTWARPGEANWSEVACFGFAYAKEPEPFRARLRQAIREGAMGERLVPPPAIDGGVCPRDVAYEPLYRPEPSCYPVEARVPVALGVASVVLGGLGTLILIKVLEQIRGSD